MVWVSFCSYTLLVTLDRYDMVLTDPLKKNSLGPIKLSSINKVSFSYILAFAIHIVGCIANCQRLHTCHIHIIYRIGKSLSADNTLLRYINSMKGYGNIFIFWHIDKNL